MCFREALRLAHELGDWRSVAMAVEGVARTEIARGRYEEGVLLLGAAAPIWRASLGAVPTRWRAWLEEWPRRAEAKLGTRRFQQAWKQGLTLSMVDTVSRVLDQAAPASPRLEPPGRYQLTRREAEVAALVAQGLRNREIAERLVVSERTVESHVEHILAKLGLSSRVQVAALAAEMGLEAAPGST
jgi:DNA-binding CsgD family transcriptional regulator